MTIRLLIADDQKMIRQGLRAMLEREDDMEVIAEAKNGREALKLAKKHLPDVLIMDVMMPDMNGIDSAHQVIKAIPGAKVLALSMYVDKWFVVGMLRAGASGYLLKASAFEELKYAIHTVKSGQCYLSPEITGVVIKDYAEIAQAPSISEVVSDTLTSRERQVLQLISEGKTTLVIAETLNVSVKTIETYRRNIMQKVDLHSIAGLTKYAIRAGLTTVDQ